MLKRGIQFPVSDHTILVFVRFIKAGPELTGDFGFGQLAILVCIEPFQQRIFQSSLFVTVTLAGDIDDAVFYNDTVSYSGGFFMQAQMSERLKISIVPLSGRTSAA